MTGKGSTKPRGWVSYNRTGLKVIAADNDGNGAEAVQVKIQRAQMLLENLNLELSLVIENISIIMMDRDQFKYKINYLTDQRRTQASDSYTSWDRIHIKDLEHAMEEKYYEHHGRAIEKHLLIRDQEDIIRNSRRKMVHQRNSMAGERRLIKDVRLAEDTRAKIIVSGITNNCSNYEEDKKNIQARRAELWGKELTKMPLKEMISQIVELGNKVELWEKELTKMYTMKEEVINFIRNHKFLRN